MRFLIFGDMHIRHTPPENRVDDFFNTQREKILAAFALGESEGCDIAVQPGDLWDNPHPSKYVMAAYIELLKAQTIPLYTVLGQHDISFRNFEASEKYATHLLDRAGAVHLVRSDKANAVAPSITIQGAWFEQPAPAAERSLHPILLAHASVGDKPLFPGQVLPSPRDYIRANPGYKLIVLGDYHYTFSDCYNGTTIVNAGCLVRKTVAENDLVHKPCVFVYDTVTAELVQHFLPIRPVEQVFDLSVKEHKSADNRLQQFLQALAKDRALSVSFEENLARFYNDHATSADVQRVIAAAFENATAPKEEK